MNSFEILLDEKRKFVRLTAAGIIDYPSLEKMIDTAQKAAIDNGYDILYDVRQTQTKVPLANYFFIPRNMEIFKDVRSRGVAVVILASVKDRSIENYKFYATVLSNLGYKVRVFYEEAEAVNWLVEPESEDNYDAAHR